ncbi:hypothetical protein HW49_00455 [Porphyromonadaceae bacterium COT-184 OH4590]|nr:hypothetical protein HW49_00455 [Porphyromonadaceae bacterium COT-184 OH4590]MDO4725701.1 hypothetical protein [Porphyromonadaceae bacterium]
MKTKRILLLVLMVDSIFAFSQKEEKTFGYKGFIGGMFIHAGYVESKQFEFTDKLNNKYVEHLNGLTAGIGGHVKVFLSDHFRVGTEGYLSKHSYENKSNISITWWGILLDYYTQIGRFKPFVGNTIGRGECTHIKIFHPIENDYIADETVSVRKYYFMNTIPFVGVEYVITERIHLIFKTDYMFNISNPQNDFVTGPRFYIGFSFKNK